jgi:hypothetical protein
MKKRKSRRRKLKTPRCSKCRGYMEYFGTRGWDWMAVYHCCGTSKLIKT